MYNLISALNYKLFKQKTLFFLLAFVIIVSLVSSYSTVQGYGIASNANIVMSGKVSLSNSFNDIFMIFISALFSALFVGNNFTTSTIQRQITEGYSRLRIILSNFAVYALGTSIIALIYPLITGLVVSSRFGWSDQAAFITDLGFIIRVIILSTIVNIGVTSIFFLFAFIFRDTVKTACVSMAFPVVISIVIPILRSIPIIRNFANILPISLYGITAGLIISSKEILLCIISGLVFTVINVSISYLIFKKTDLK